MIFRNDLSPFIFNTTIFGQEIGLRWYGLAYIFGIGLGYLTFERAIRKGLIKGATEKSLDRIVWAIVIAVIGGSRLGYVLQNIGKWGEDPFFPLRLNEGGMSFHGGLLGVWLAFRWVSKKDGISFWSLADLATLPAMLGLGFGRIANFVNQELWGRPTQGDWGVVYSRVDALPRHPSELYESASHFLGFFILLWASKRVGFGSGKIAAIFLVVYGGFRVLTDFYREEPLLGPLNTGQWASLAMLVLGVLILWWQSRRTITSPESSA